MKQAALLTCALVLCLLCSCGKAERSVDFSQWDLSPVSRVQLDNCHNGQTSWISDEEEVTRICAFFQTVSAEHGASAKGYYEGTYRLRLLDARQAEVVSVVFGDADVLYCGTLEDGSPVRYILKDTSAEEIVSFLSRYDTSHFAWEQETPGMPPT